MKTKKMHRAYIINILFVLLFTGCEYKDLTNEGQVSPSSNNVNVRFLWQECPEASPQGMLLWVFSGQGQPVTIPFADKNGGTATLNTGQYQLLAYNDGTELLNSGNTWETFEVSAQPRDLIYASAMFTGTRTVPRAQGTETEIAILEPDSLQTDALATFTVGQGSQQADAVFTMREATKTWRFIVNDVDNLDAVTEFTATISGMSGSWFPAQAQCSDTHCIIPFTMKPSGPQSIAGEVRAFGHCPNESHSHQLVVYYTLTSGQKFYTVVDVSGQLHSTEHWGGGEQPIVIDKLPVPDPMSAESGLQTDVYEWEEVVIPLYM